MEQGRRVSLSAESEIVIIGGGAIGCGVAYSLASAGKSDVLLIEREGDVGQVTTAQGAGLCGQVRSSVERARLAMHSVRTFRELQRDPETQPDWHEVGSMRLAFSTPRVEELRRLRAVCERAGLEVALIDRAEAERLWPPLDLSAAQAVLWCPSDGYMTPPAVTKAYQRPLPAHGRALRDGDDGHRDHPVATAASPRCRRLAARCAAAWSSTPRAPTPTTSPASPVSTFQSSPCATNTTSPSRFPRLKPTTVFPIPDEALRSAPEINCGSVAGRRAP